MTDIAQENHLIQRCHTLVWHSQLAPWVESTNWTADALTEVVVNHITNVMEHYKGKCYAWDVVNEALNEDGTYRESVFYTTLGEDFIKLAFATAASVDPGAKLYYNDYNIESPGNKSEGALRIVKLLQDDGIRIDGVGLQAHFQASGAPSLDEQSAVIASYAALGVEVAYTELDVRIDLPLNDTNLEWQKEVYMNVSEQKMDSRCTLKIEKLTMISPRLQAHVFRAMRVLASPFGTFMIRSVGCPRCSPAKEILCYGLKTLPSTRHITVSLRLSRKAQGKATAEMENATREISQKDDEEGKRNPYVTSG